VKIIETERLVLRQMKVEDAEFIFELVNEAAFIRNIGDKGSGHSKMRGRIF
jgi:[ribosomal protein S5]-alanine N-acetyltransferase